MAAAIAESKLTRKDFVSDQDVRWCPGCGDYAILAQMQKILPDVGVPRENIVFVSGIGCSSRFPYYMNTYGVHSIHGRAPTIATGLKATNPDLSVWVITGDGDGLSIGGNHLIHCLRRNVDLKIILFNNRVYGLTKGQYSPTSGTGYKSKSTPQGSIDYPLNPIAVALGAEATFVARAQDNNIKHLSQVLHQAAQHKGTAFVEIFQNCPVFNRGAWEHTTDANTRDDHILFLEDGKPLIFGKDSDRGLRLNGLQPEVVQLGNGIGEDDLLVHRADDPNSSYAYLLGRLEPPDFPVPFGLLRQVQKPTYDEMLTDQVEEATQTRGDGDLTALFRGGDTWVVD
ncbi:MAG: 2-oxoacid:ferredoxin oxidoreductase subunit beta [Candidatus Latescibacteria bacterium]|nr:2-oxoacid:ferredoxin oxidoreductase subunit beta [Candidatus Latescibacterota bacterium]